MKPGIYYDMSNAEYHAEPGLSNSGMSKLAVEPLHYWFHQINPDLPCSRLLMGKTCGVVRSEHPAQHCKYFQASPETVELRKGSAMHAAVLEPETFLDRYYCQVNRADFGENCVDTVSDMQKLLTERGVSYKKSMTKPQYVDFVKGTLPEVLFLEEEESRAAKINFGRQMLTKPDWENVYGMAGALRREEALRDILNTGERRREVSVFAIHPVTGALLKCRLDFINLTLGVIVDPKSFSAGGLPIDRAVAHAIRYRGYARQAVFYLLVLELAGLGPFRWINAFVESEPPYVVRIREMGPNLTARARYWLEEEAECSRLIKVYADCMANGWAFHQVITPVRDSEIPGLGLRGLE